MSDLTPTELEILETLGLQPWLTPQQLARWLVRSPSRVHADMKQLLARRLIQRVNPRGACIPARVVLALTNRGVQVLAEHAKFDATSDLWRYQLSRARHQHLLWVLERVYRVRELMLALPSDGQLLDSAAVEVGERFEYQSRFHQLHLHGRGVLFDRENRNIPFVVEWDPGVLPISVKRMAAFVLWQLDPCFLGRINQVRFPVLLFVASSRERQVEMLRILRRAALRYGVRLPSAFMTTEGLLAREGVHGPIWFSTGSDKWERVFEGIQFVPADRKVFSLVVPHTKSNKLEMGTFDIKPVERDGPLTYADLLQFKLQLQPQAKRVLAEIGAHPFLSSAEIVLMLEENKENVDKSLSVLADARLILKHAHEDKTYYALAPLGIRYLVAEAGYGRAVKRYARQRGWQRGIRRLLYHIEHTLAINQFFLQWVKIARERKAYFRWQSELESRAYFREGSKLRRFLPDGMGYWRHNKRDLHFALEMDRTRESRANLVKKFREYYAFQEWRKTQWDDDSPLHVLVVTTSWARGETVRDVVGKLAQVVSAPRLWLWVTTQPEVCTQGLDQTIWRSIRRWEEVQRLGCLGEAG